MAYFMKGYFRPQSCICSVEYHANPQTIMTGTGAFYGIQFPEGTSRTLFITNHHVAPIRDKNEVTNIKLIFEDKLIMNVNLTPDCVKTLWFSLPCDCEKYPCKCRNLDVTIIELSTIAMKILERSKFCSLRILNPRPKDSVIMFQYPGQTLNVGTGVISNVNGHLLEYNVDTEPGSSGSPLLNSQFSALGIHCGKWKVVPGQPLQAVNIYVIIEGFKAFLNERSKGQSENDKALEWIKQISRNELHLIGPGGYGKVYKVTESNDNPVALNTESKTTVALKVIEGFGGLDVYNMKVVELKKEYDSIERLQSPGIVKLFAFIRDDQNAKLIIKMDYLEGGSLFDKIKPYNPADKYSRCIPLNETLSLNYMEQLMKAVGYLHYLKIYHGDIKPTNILFTSSDQLKLCDIGFGVHLQFASSANQAHMRKNCYYMSPERVGGVSRSAENDIWSIGATFVKMVTGQTVNHKDKFPKVNMNIAAYNIIIDEVPLNQYLLSINDENDYKKLIISQTLCPLNNRVNAEQLLATVELCKGRLPTAGHIAEEVQDSNFNQ